MPVTYLEKRVATDGPWMMMRNMHVILLKGKVGVALDMTDFQLASLTLKGLDWPFRPVLYGRISLYLEWFYTSYEFHIKSEVKIHVYMVLKAIGISIWNFLLTTNVKYTATYLLSPRAFIRVKSF